MASSLASLRPAPSPSAESDTNSGASTVRVHARRTLSLLSALLLAALLIIPGTSTAHAGSSQRTFTPTDDTYAAGGEPSMPHGDWKYAYAFGAGNQGWLRFNTAGAQPAGTTITAITLRLFVVESVISQPRIVVHPASSSWTEETLTRTNRPESQGAILGRGTTATVGQYMDIPLSPTGSLDIAGMSSFEITGDIEGTAFRFATKESDHAPQLIVTTTSGNEPSIATPVDSSRTRPFDMPTRNTTGKLMFAHYFSPYPISLDNQDGKTDYYARNYTQPNGENGKFAASGGLLRDRPALRGVLSSSDYVLDDLKTEIGQAEASGIDGFTVDLMSPDGLDWDRVVKLMKASDQTNSGFKLIAMPDMSALVGRSQGEVADLIANFVNSGGSEYRLGDGRIVVSPFYAEQHDPSWWRGVLSNLSQRGLPVAFVPTFVNFPDNINDWANISYGMSLWGGRSPSNIYTVYGEKVHDLGKVWMQSVAVQDERPIAGIYDEADGFGALRSSWDAVYATNADWVQLTTWNDYSETTSFAPSLHHGFSFLDLNAYYASKFKTGDYASVVANGLYVAHRTQFVNARPTSGQTLLQTLRSNSSPAVDIVDVTVFLTAPGTVTANVGGLVTTWSAPAGVSYHSVPLQLGTVSVSESINGSTVASVTSPWTVTASPVSQDLEYVGVSSMRNN